MLIWALLATLASIVLALIFAAYRRQVKNTCRYMAFISDKRTNMLLPSNLPFKELDNLNKEINKLLENVQKIIAKHSSEDRLLKEAITNISHDIRTPLTSLDGYFQLLARSESEEERQKYIAIIDERIDNLKYMLEELFTYTKLRNDTYQLQLEKIDFSKSVYDTLFSFYEEINSRGIEPQINFSDEQIFVDGNNEAIKRIIQNILKNAFDHGTGKLILSMKRNGDSVVFVCSNDIHGNEEIDLSQIFTRFYKANPARTHSSTGLGLSIAKQLAQRMNGNLSASVSENIFTIIFKMKTVD
ncbi:MAG: HAMP domain-containing histidine kinase [Ruminococcus sp.]|nr:HAMP domain-containing histidine kinase [Ruminococcus sp.]